MRLRWLELAAFGPFTDVRLDLGGGGPELHLVYGRNEAGKSTTLRAVTDLLYGIQEKSPDDHVHEYKKMRIGALLEGEDGTRLEVRRRKGRKNTLLGPDDRTPLDEAQLRALLRGVSREMFETVFGLSHYTLRSGASALLEGGGDVGESLFDAGIGGRGIHRVLEQLEAEAAELWKRNASKPKLNVELRAYKDAVKQIKQDAVSSSSIHEQEKQLERARAALEEREAEHRALRSEQIRLERHRMIIPELARFDRLTAEREALGDVGSLTEDLVARRREAQRTLERAGQAMESAGDAIRRQEEKLAGLEIPELLVTLDDERVDDLQDRLAAHRKGTSDLPRREADLRAAEANAVEILRQMGRPAHLDEASAARVSSDQATRIRALASRRSGLDEAVRGAREALESRQLRIEELRAAIARLGEESDVGPLRRAVGDARRVGELDDAVERARGRAEDAERRAGQLLAGLAPFEGTVEQAAELPVPPEETVDRLERALEGDERDAADLEARLRDLRQRQREARRDLEALVAAASVPSEAQLGEARGHRDGLWSKIREGEPATGPAGDELDGAIREADTVADRLRREAERVTKHAALEASLTALQDEIGEIEGERTALEERRSGLEEERAELLDGLGLPQRLRPEELRGWLRRLDELRRVAAEAEGARADHRRLSERRDEHRRALAAALEDLEAPEESGGERLAPLLDAAASRLEDALERERRRQALAEQVEEHSREASQHERQLRHAEEELDEWRQRWAEAAREVGLSGDATVEEAADVLNRLEQLGARLATARDLRHRIEAIQSDSRRLDEDSRALVERHAPDLADLDPEARISELVRRHRRMRHHEEDRRAIVQELEDRRAELADARREHRDASTVLEEAMRRAGVETPAELDAAEERASRARDLDRQINELRADLAEHGEGASIEQLRDETDREIARLRDALGAGREEQRADRSGAVLVRLRLSDIEDDIEEADDQRTAARQEVQRIAEGLRIQRSRSAADAAETAQAHLAAIRQHAHRYARARLAAAILRSEVERYRERNQDPILRRASELFPRLTLGDFTGLRAGFGADDEPVLQCIRKGGQEVSVDGLSEGTRDQLYLALRVASLERHAEQSEPLPVVLDDVLSLFDEPRTSAALEVLGELAASTQVLLFTHHAHVVDLAREVVGEGTLREHDLDRLRDRPAPLTQMGTDPF